MKYSRKMNKNSLYFFLAKDHILRSHLPSLPLPHHQSKMSDSLWRKKNMKFINSLHLCALWLSIFKLDKGEKRDSTTSRARYQQTGFLNSFWWEYFKFCDGRIFAECDKTVKWNPLHFYSSLSMFTRDKNSSLHFDWGKREWVGSSLNNIPVH